MDMPDSMTMGVGAAMATQDSIDAVVQRVAEGDRPMAMFQLGEDVFGSGRVTEARAERRPDGTLALVLTFTNETA